MTQEEYDVLTKAISDAEEHLAEVETEHLSETARFGDSWPGAQLEIRGIREWIAQARASLPPAPQVIGWRLSAEEVIASASADEDDIPF